MSFFNRCRGFARAACLIALTIPAWAQQTMSLQEAQRLALGRSQQLAAQDAAAAAVRESSVAAGQLPDPMLKLGVDNVPVSGADRFSLTRDFMTGQYVGIAQELTRSDKRRLRVERVQRDGERIQAERIEAIAAIQRDTALAWLESYYGQAVGALLRHQLQQAQLEVQGAEIAYRAGRGSQADVFAARTAIANLQDKLRQNQRQEQSARLMLARWVGTQEAGRPLAAPPNWQASPVAALTSHDQVRHLPHLAVLAAQVTAAETELRQAQANTRADWTLEAKYNHRGPGFPDQISVGVSIPLQIDRPNRQDREVAAKLASLAEARAKYEETVRVHDAEVRVLVNDWTSGKERVAWLNAELLPAARLRTEAALTAYQSAKGELTAVLAARREETEARTQVLNLEMETARLWAQLNYLIPDSAGLAATKEQP